MTYYGLWYTGKVIPMEELKGEESHLEDFSTDSADTPLSKKLNTEQNGVAIYAAEDKEIHLTTTDGRRPITKVLEKRNTGQDILR